jgi:SAM-dependent methyltransferase
VASSRECTDPVAGMDQEVSPPPEVLSYYAGFPEESRLGLGPSRLEFERTKEILARVLPRPPARIVDVGGAAGAYSLWLAEQGYEVHLVDASPRLVEVARTRSAKSTTPLASLSVADARRLPQENGSAAAVLVMGPLTTSRRRRIVSRHFVKLSVFSPGMAWRSWRPSRATPRPWTG